MKILTTSATVAGRAVTPAMVVTSLGPTAAASAAGQIIFIKYLWILKLMIRHMCWDHSHKCINVKCGTAIICGTCRWKHTTGSRNPGYEAGRRPDLEGDEAQLNWHGSLEQWLNISTGLE